MNDPLNNMKPLRLLTDGYKTQFATFVFESEGFTELLMEKAHQFVDNELDLITDEDPVTTFATFDGITGTCEVDALLSITSESGDATVFETQFVGGVPGPVAAQ